MVCLALVACGPADIRVPASARPTAAPGAPNLLVRLDLGNDEWGVGVHLADYLSDGTVIRKNGETLERNVLTATGLASLNALLLKDSDFLGLPGSIKPTVVPGMGAMGRGAITNTLVLARSDGSRYAIDFPNLKSPDAHAWAPDPAIEHLNALASALRDPATLVGASGLANATWAAYQPVQMAVFVSWSEVNPRFVELGLGPDIAKVGWRFQDRPDALGEAFDGPGTIQRCAFLPAADVLSAITSWPPSVGSTLATARLAAGGTWRSGTLLWGAKTPTTALGLAVVALLPEDQVASCADAIAY